MTEHLATHTQPSSCEETVGLNQKLEQKSSHNQCTQTDGEGGTGADMND
jgi:hypothetical protein